MSRRFRIAHIVITFLPTIWFPFVVNWLGEYIWLVVTVNNKKQFTVLGWVLSTIVILLVILFQLLHFIKSSDPQYESLKENNKALSAVEDSLRSLCISRKKQYINYIEKSLSNLGCNELVNIHDPVRCLCEILSEIENFFVYSLSIRRDQISATLAYTMLGDDKWRWIDDQYVDDSSLRYLISNKKSAIYQIYSGQRSMLFHTDKRVAFENEEYVYNEKDEEHKRIGTIICAKVACGKHNRDYVFGILTISTYGKHILTDLNDNNPAKEFIKIHILEPYFERILMELALLYAKSMAK